MKEKIKYENQRDTEFAKWIATLECAENINRCIQCGNCSSACPFSQWMDYTPRQIIYLSKEGFKKEVLSSFTPWLCASCYTCRSECPKEIKITDIMYAIKRKAIEENSYPKISTVVIAKEFSRMINLTGKVTESYLMAIVLLKTNWIKLLGMTKLGINMLLKGRISIFPETVKNRSDIRKMLNYLDKNR